MRTRVEWLTHPPQYCPRMSFLRRRGRDASPPRETAILGTVACPTGDLLVLDFGLMRLWSGDEPPVLAEGLADPDVVRHANEAADFEIVGPNAAAVAAAVNLAAVKGRYGFDLPADAAYLATEVAAVCEQQRLDARVQPIARMPHRQRLLRLLDEQPEGVEVPFHGPWGVAVRGVPRDRSLPVRGQRMDPGGPDAERWHSVWVECSSEPVHASHEIGYVLVDEARLMFADPLALNSWRSDVSFDGLADVVFWGRDDEEVARRLGAGIADHVGGSPTFGWVDRPVDEAEERWRVLHALRDDTDLLVAVDFRPHDHHRQLLAQANQSSTESGTIEVGGSLLTGFFTSWGDGAFPVFRDVAADGSLCRVRVELGAPEIVALRRRLERLWFGDLSKLAIVSARVVRDGAPVGWLHREPPDHDTDSGWRIFSGDESQEFIDDPANAAVLPLSELLEIDATLEELFGTPAPAAFERAATGEFERCEPPPAE